MNTTVMIESQPSPLEGQKHRSSINFTTEQFDEKCSLLFSAYYNYGKTTQERALNVVYDIKADKTGIDPTYLSDVTFGECHQNTHHRNLYIANPKNAEEKFTVVIEPGVYVKSEPSHQPGQKHRSSDDFSAYNFQDVKIVFNVYYDYGTKEQQHAKGITFDIMENKPVKKDPVLLSGIQDGTVDIDKKINGKTDIYIANPVGALKEFTVVLTVEN